MARHLLGAFGSNYLSNKIKHFHFLIFHTTGVIGAWRGRIKELNKLAQMSVEQENLRMSKKTYSENQAIVERLWKQYQKDNDPKWLADICLNVPFFDHPEVGEEIAKLLEKNA